MAEPKCGAIIEWRQFQGMLLHTALGYTGRCPVSHREIAQKKRPRPGATCGLPASTCRDIAKRANPKPEEK